MKVFSWKWKVFSSKNVNECFQLEKYTGVSWNIWNKTIKDNQLKIGEKYIRKSAEILEKQDTDNNWKH